MVNGEVPHDGVFVIFKNGSISTETGYQGWNSGGAVASGRGYAPFYYDGANNNATTPHCYFIQYTILVATL